MQNLDTLLADLRADGISRIGDNHQLVGHPLTIKIWQAKKFSKLTKIGQSKTTNRKFS